MLSYEALVSLSFRLLDLCIISGLGVFLFLRWGLPNVKKEMQQEHDAWKQLQDEIQSQCARQEQLQRTIKEDQDTAHRLRKQVDTWRSVIEHAQKERLLEKEHTAQHLKEIYHKRQTHIMEQALYKEVVPEALQQAEHKLKTTFGDTQKAQQFIADVLTGLEKEHA